MDRQERDQLIDSKRDDLNKIIAKLLVEKHISVEDADALTDAIEEVVHQERMSVHEMNDRAQARANS